MISKIDNYKRLKGIADECKRIITNSKNGTVHFAKQSESYHLVAFSFITEGFNSHTYEKSNELAEYLGEACKEFKNKIMERVIEIAENKAKEARNAAKEEAKLVLQETEE